MLKRLLDAIAVLETKAVISVLVADNDAQGRAGLDLCLSMENYPWPLTAMIAPQHGQVRNVLIEYALMTDASFIAMINDDEWPKRDWMDQLLSRAHATGADLLKGPELRGHGDLRHAPMDMLEKGGNFLIRRAMLQDMAGPWCNPQFA